ncbi:MAG: histone deacetylase [Candidatus Aminicenantes bacterium]|nr:histone deacetylase [Candidatus Aminicenantes bacterium]
MSTGIVRDPRFNDHFMGPGHVECPERLEAIADILDAGLDFSLDRIEARPASSDEIAYIHAPEYIDFLSHTRGRAHVQLDPDTATSSLSFDAALLAAGGTIEAADFVLAGPGRNAFALVRPPGHHAERGQAKGFCLFNNVAIAAEHLVRKRGVRRILIADWDVHHGNGTQNAFYSRNDILFFSTHRFPFYPGSGRWDEIGAGEGRGYTVNVPLSAGKTDGDYLFIYRNILGPIARAFEPEFILVSAGFDIFAGDPLGGMNVSLEGFAGLASELVTVAEDSCGGRLLLVLEGGYHIEGQALAVKDVLRRLAGARSALEIRADISITTHKEISPVIDIQRRFWPL